MAMNKQRKTGNILNIVSYDASGNVTLPAAIAAGTLHDAAYTRFVKPNGGTYVVAASTATGAIAVTLPVGKSNSMLRVTIKVYLYSTNQSFEIHAGGYDYDNGSTQTWANNPYAYIIGNPGIDRRFTVRFGYNTSTNKAIIYIGELNTVWSYPQVWVTEMQVGYSGMNSNWLNACSVAFEASAFQNPTATITNAQVGYAVSTNTANAVVLRDASGNFSAGTITSTAVTATNFYDNRGSNNVNLGNGGLEGRGVVAGYSGSSYSGVGYNVRHTAVGGEYTAPGTDTSSYLVFTNGGFAFYGAPAGAAGRALSYTTLATLNVSGIFNAVNVTVNNNQVLHAANYNSYAPTLTGSGASGTWAISITGNAATATNLSTNRSNWVTNGTITAVVGQLAWRHYGNSHTIFDASNGISPDGTSVNNTTPDNGWIATYPTLMGWNGSQTYGVRVHTARNAETLGGVGLAQIVYGDTGSRRGVNLISDWNQTTFPDAAFLSSENSSSNAPSTDFLYGVQMSFHRSGPDYRSQFVTSLYGNNVYYLRTRRDTQGWTSWVTLIHSSNYNSFAPTLTGTGASGTWDINITGTAAGETLATVTGRGATTATAVQFTNSTASTSVVSGAVRVTGGVGIGGNIYAGGNIVASGDVTAFSDERIKENIVTIDNALEKVNSLRGVYFTRKNSDDKSRKLGVIAQEVRKILPEVVLEDGQGTMHVAYANMVGVLIEAVKDLKKQIDYLAENR